MAKKIVIADADIGFAESIAPMFTAAGWEVSIAADGDDALKKARSIMPHVVMLEVNLPRIDGYKVCRFLKFDKKFSRIAVVFCTLGIDEELDRLCREVGANEVLEKSLPQDELVQKLDSLVHE